MLGNIKSLYFQKMIFSNLNEKTKLKIIKYNNSLKSLMKINLNYYILYAGKFIIYETNEKGKEYCWGRPGEIIFEGEYKNGERNGKGKEYYEYSRLMFEGNYKNGKRNGKGKEFYDNGKIKFEGEFLYGQKWNGRQYNSENNNYNEIKNGDGFIMEYDNDGNLVYEGEYKNGKRNGKGKEFYKKDSIKFEGEYFNDKKWNGKLYEYDIYDDKKIYEIKNGKGLIKENDN